MALNGTVVGMARITSAGVVTMQNGRFDSAAWVKPGATTGIYRCTLSGSTPII